MSSASMDLFFLIYLSLTIVSFTIAYGLLRLFKWAWYPSFMLSLFGIIVGSLSLALMGMSESTLMQGAPRIVIDALVVIILLTRDARSAFMKK